MTRALLVAALAATVALLPARSPGCAIAPKAGQWADTAGEVAVILWDDVAGVEHFTRSAAFTGSAADFGFLVPTPGKPTLADAPGPISGRLEPLTVSRVVVKRRLAEPGCFAAVAPQAAMATAAPPPVTVVGRQRVGDFDATILTGTDPAAVNRWLGANGYASRPPLTDWIGSYTTDDWHLTAFKLADGAGGGLKAVRLSFSTALPFYPYREPADVRPGQGPRLLKLFVLAPWRADAVAGPERGAFISPWTRPMWAGPVGPEVVEGTAVACGLPAPEAAKLAGRSWTLTEFEDTASPRLAGDLYFRPSPDQSRLERPPSVEYVEVEWPYWAGCFGVLVCVPVGVWLTWKLIRRAVRGLPAAPLD